MSVRRLSELSPGELDAAIGDVPVVLVPLGTIEWHSHHLPVGLDALKAEALAAAAAERTRAVLAPTSWLAAGGVAYPHTLRLPGQLIEPLLGELLVQLAGFGFQLLGLVNGHYGLENTLVTRRAALYCAQRTGALAIAVADYELLVDLGARGDHAGVWETSLLWAVRPELVRLHAVPATAELPGVIGEDPRGRASAQLGRYGIEAAAQRLAATLERCLAEDAAARDQHLMAQRAGVAALEHLAELRLRLPREEVPPVQTPAWLAYVAALNTGDYEAARVAAGRKLEDPAE